jgi:hypothetical protein
MHQRITSLLAVTLFVLCCGPAKGQLSAPQTEAIYGGRILGITGYAKAADSSRIFITTESANSAFYADVYHPASDTAEFGAFRAIPALDASSMTGYRIQQLDAHPTSGRMFFVDHQRKLKSVRPEGGSLSAAILSDISSFVIHEDRLLALEGNKFHFGDLDADGNYLPATGSPINMPFPTGANPTVAVNPVNQRVYLFFQGTLPKVYRSNLMASVLNSTVNFTALSMSGLPTTFQWTGFGIAPSGRLFVAGSDFANKHVAYSDDESTWTTYPIPFGGAPGNTISFGGDSSDYAVYFASLYNPSKGESGFWQGFGTPGGSETHPNDGAVFGDPVGKRVVYLTTDQGIGASINGGARIFEINTGVEAVQVKDFAMHLSNKNVAWLASKAGIRKVSSYRSTPKWTAAIFPNGDGAPYNAVAMAGTDTNSVYAANLRVYKSINGGAGWKRVFSAEDAPYNFNGMGTPTNGAARITSMAVCEADTNLVLVGYEIDLADKGGLFFSPDAGRTWSQVLLEASSIGKDVDVNDIVFSSESGKIVAYVAVSYDLSSPQGRSVYRLEWDGTNWTAAQDMDPATTSTGTVIVATIRALAVSATGDTLVACGTDAGINHPVAYYKVLSGAAKWTPFPVSGFPFEPNKQGKAITIGVDTVYVAVDNEVYFLASGESAWQSGYTYPMGTEINFLFYDELLVGTGTGLYGHDGIPNANTGLSDNFRKTQLFAYPNPVNQEDVHVGWPEDVSQAVTVRVIDRLGRVIWRSRFNPGTDIVIPNKVFARPGMYLLELNSAEVTATTKLIKR